MGTRLSTSEIGMVESLYGTRGADSLWCLLWWWLPLKRHSPNSFCHLNLLFQVQRKHLASHIVVNSLLLIYFDHNFLWDLKTVKRKRGHFGSYMKSHCPQSYLVLVQVCRAADRETLLLLCTVLNPCERWNRSQIPCPFAKKSQKRTSKRQCKKRNSVFFFLLIALSNQ